MRRTMHILDVISGVSRSSKCAKIVGGWGFVPDPLAEFKGLTSKAPTSKERRGEGRGAKMIYAPGARNHSNTHDNTRLELYEYS